MDEDDHKKGHSITQTIQTLGRRKSLPKHSKKEDGRSDSVSSLPEPHRFQTIQSFSPSEVKLLLSQRFAQMSSDNLTAQGSQSAPASPVDTEGKRKFSLARSNFKNRKSVHITAASPEIFQKDADSPQPARHSEVLPFQLVNDSIRADMAANFHRHASLDSYNSGRTGITPEAIKSQFAQQPLPSPRNSSVDKDELILQLKDQIYRERRIYTEHLSALHAKNEKFKAEMLELQEALEAMVTNVEAREVAMLALIKTNQAALSKKAEEV